MFNTIDIIDIKKGMVLYLESSYNFKGVYVAESDGFKVDTAERVGYYVRCRNVVTDETEEIGGVSPYSPSFFHIATTDVQCQN